MSPEAKNKHVDGKPFAYVPPNAKENVENESMDPPEVFYEDRRLIYNKEKIEKAIGGKRNIDEKNS